MAQRKERDGKLTFYLRIQAGDDDGEKGQGNSPLLSFCGYDVQRVTGSECNHEGNICSVMTIGACFQDYRVRADPSQWEYMKKLSVSSG